MVAHRPSALPPPADIDEALNRSPVMRAMLDRLEVIQDLLAGREKPFFTIDEVAARYGRSAYTVRRWAHEGRLQTIRIDSGGPRGRLLVPLGEIQRLDSHGGLPVSEGQRVNDNVTELKSNQTSA